jgi:hypothetical protein
MMCELRYHVTAVISVACVAPKEADETSKANKRIKVSPNEQDGFIGGIIVSLGRLDKKSRD